MEQRAAVARQAPEALHQARRERPEVSRRLECQALRAVSQRERQARPEQQAV
ncbi:MAG TPA: hypothetical protein VKT71_02015 [Candidatus Acidoferrales bacterium]|nr:hypothetical protein [Candidatus Acidoferrales bacterium]